MKYNKIIVYYIVRYLSVILCYTCFICAWFLFLCEMRMDDIRVFYFVMNRFIYFLGELVF